MTRISPSDAVRILLQAAVPERISEFNALWQTYSPAVEIAADTPGFTVNANKRRILFEQKALDVLWIIGFSAWEAIGTYSPAIAVALLTGQRLEDALSGDEDRGCVRCTIRQD
jgi:hypothetical protein